MQRRYYVYILTNRFRTKWHVGITCDLNRRVKDLNMSLNKPNFWSQWLKSIYLVYFEDFPYIVEAIKKEDEIKSWNNSRKKDFVRSKNPDFKLINANLPNRL